MSLVAYGCSDESSDEEEVNPAQEEPQTTTAQKEIVNLEKSVILSPVQQNSKIHISLPAPKYQQNTSKPHDYENGQSNKEENTSTIKFDALPKPIRVEYTTYDDVVEDDDIPLFKPKPVVVEKPTKQDRTPVRISIPSLSDFKDVDEDLEKSKNRRTASKKGTGLFAILPPPQSEISSKKNNFVPHVLTKAATNAVPTKPVVPVAKVPVEIAEKSTRSPKVEVKVTKNPLAVIDYESGSEDDDEGGEKHDFFSLTKPKSLPESIASAETNFFSIPEEITDKNLGKSQSIIGNVVKDTGSTMELGCEIDETKNYSGKTLVSTVMNLPRDEILLKNKAEVGPKLPVPEQEFNVDSEGNVAFDDKAIEYLCGKRGIKRKNQMIDEANIIEINGEDIKPDEREWMVKALTEEPVQRPVSMQGSGPSSQSKKKHQITYLAHQAKAMEVELKNTWSQNKMARKQTQSKYGF